MTARPCWCCDNDVPMDERRLVADRWDGRMNGYCFECSTARCDAFPGECPRAVA